MVYAKNSTSAGKLSALVQNHDPDGDDGMAKTYLAVLSREPDFEQGELSDLLFHDKQKNKSFAVDSPRKGVKEAKLIWKKLALRGRASIPMIHPFFPGDPCKPSSFHQN